MENDWLKIKSCFAGLRDVDMPSGMVTRLQLVKATARLLRPRGDAKVQRVLISRILFICFGE